MQHRYYETTIWNYALGRERWFQPLFYSLFAYVITLETSTWNPPLGLALAPASATTELVFPVSFWSVNPSSGWFPLLLSITFNTINTKRKSEWYKNFYHPEKIQTFYSKKTEWSEAQKITQKNMNTPCLSCCAICARSI